MLRRFVPLLLAPLLGSCQPPDIVVRAAFLGNALVFIPVDPGDSDSLWCWNDATVLDDRLRAAWQFNGGSGACRTLFPLYYGRAPEGAQTAIKAARLEPDRLYLLIGSATAGVYGAFSLTRAGNLWTVHNVDPESPGPNALRQAWWEQVVLNGQGATEPAAEPATRP